MTWGCEVCGGDGYVEMAFRMGDWPQGDPWAVTRGREDDDA